jgi:hypothetical protein
MTPIEFWAANQGVFMEPETAWSIRYTGSLDDYERYREQIDNLLSLNARHRNLTILRSWAVKDGDGFIVYVIAR